MKLLFLVNSLGMGGAEKHTIQLASGLATRGFEVALDNMRNENHHEVGDSRVAFRSTRGNGLAEVSAIRRLARFVGEFRPDIIVGVNDRPLYYAHAARLLSGHACAIATIRHSTGFPGTRQRALATLYRPLICRTDLIVYVSQRQRDWWQERGYNGSAVHVIPNGVDCSEFAPPAREKVVAARDVLGLADGNLVFGVCAALRPEKNVSQFVAAVACLTRNGVPVSGLIIGDGPMSMLLKAQVGRLGLENHIKFAGAQKDVRPYIAACDVGLLTSTSVETFSLAALEFMAMGRPMVMSDIGGASEMIRDGVNGFLYPVGELDTLVHRLQELTDPDYPARLGAVARRIVEETFSLTSMCDAYATLFDDLSVQGRRATSGKS